MKNKYSFVVFIFLLIDVLLVVWLLLGGHTIAVLNPKGMIAMKERNIIITSIFLMLLVAIPVLILTFWFAWKYREGNSHEQYTPDWQLNTKLEFLWWAIPGMIVLALSFITWKSTHELDPYKPIASNLKPITIQVVALRWKWLFIYPEQHIATVNFIQFPARTPINFELTADAPMNSFWIPQLGGQIYAMSGMGTHLHLMADQPGEYRGSAAEISGKGFAGMRFIAKASSQADFDAWVQSVRKSSNMLDLSEYNKIAEPSEDNPVSLYALTEENLYNEIMMKFMVPSKPSTMPGMENMAGMDH